MNRLSTGLLVIGFCSFIAIDNVLAESRSREGGSSSGASAQPSNQMQLQVRQLMADNQALQAQIAELTSKVDAADKASKDLEKDLRKSTATADKFKESTDLLRGKLDETVGKYKVLIEKYKAKLLETADALHKENAAKNKLQLALNDETAAKVACVTNNQQLVKYNKEILAHYQDKGVMDSLLQKDKVAGLKSVEIENILQEYQDKIDDEKFEVKATVSE